MGHDDKLISKLLAALLDKAGLEFVFVLLQVGLVSLSFWWLLFKFLRFILGSLPTACDRMDIQFSLIQMRDRMDIQFSLIQMPLIFEVRTKYKHENST